MEDEEFQFPWGLNETIAHLEEVRDFFAAQLEEKNYTGHGARSGMLFRYDMNRAIDALRFQKKRYSQEGIDFPVRIGGEGYIIRTLRGGNSTVLKGKISEVYFLKNWREDEMEEKPMVLCAVVKGLGRGIVGEKVFATQEEATDRLREAIDHEQS